MSDWTPRAPWKRKIVHAFRLERWRIYAMVRYYRGLGSPTFEFEFRLGFPSKHNEPDWLIYEGEESDDLGVVRRADEQETKQ